MSLRVPRAFADRAQIVGLFQRVALEPAVAVTMGARLAVLPAIQIDARALGPKAALKVFFNLADAHRKAPKAAPSKRAGTIAAVN
jgi:hypothetical protein